MPSAATATGPESPGRSHVSFDDKLTVIAEGNNSNGNNDDGDKSDDESSSSSPPTPLYLSTRLKGYITLFVSALYNFLAAKDANDANNGHANKFKQDWCFYLDDLENFFMADRKSMIQPARLRYAMACSMITVIIVGWIILCHLDVCTPLRKNIWPKVFAKSGKIELCILLSLTAFWMCSTWLNTSIRGPAGEGKDQYNLYFTSWICVWACFWTLERWCTASGRASFVRFVRSWPNRCPLWILTFLMSMMDFLFTLDLSRNWEEGTLYNPYVLKLYSEVDDAEWILLFFTTVATFLVSFAWIMAEIFRESRTNVKSVKSDVETYVEGVTAYILLIFWIALVCIVTMPGGAASLLGNLYFTTWSTLFSVIGTLMWWQQDYRKDIVNAIQEEEDKYELAKRAIRRREERRLAKLAEEEKRARENGRLNENQRSTGGSAMEESKVEEDDDVALCEDDPVDDDITISITSDYNRSRLGTGASSLESNRERSQSPPIGAKPSSTTTPADSEVTTDTSLFVTVLSYFVPFGGQDEKPKSHDNNEQKGEGDADINTHKDGADND